MQRLTGAAQSLGQVAQPGMFGDAVRKPCLTRKPRRGAIIPGQKGAERVKNGGDINRFLQQRPGERAQPAKGRRHHGDQR